MIVKIAVILLSILFFGATTGNGQKDAITDKLLEEICKSINKRPDATDSARIIEAFEKHLYPVLGQMKKKEQQEAWDLVFYRLQRNCLSFNEILARNAPPSKGDWQAVASKPVTTLDKNTCTGLLKHEILSYIEVTGDTVRMEIKDGFYYDRFIDGSYSRLKFRWIGDCDFEIEFIESNNESRKNFSKAGDLYRYRLLTKEDGYYDVAVESVGSEGFMLFKIYFR